MNEQDNILDYKPPIPTAEQMRRVANEYLISNEFYLRDIIMPKIKNAANEGKFRIEYPTQSGMTSNKEHINYAFEKLRPLGYECRIEESNKIAVIEWK